ncbi:hypothetical protein [Bacteroides sp.]|uniref:hypothetical protein n=1 Tax=Bacteroides sp. TaxID=29523 RepID=UPI0023BF1609|nr:hypothetical protein [Bacteroides sp.]MDE5711174.1 hypothetical protein [Bacteroides sp.]MDE6215656.1 hypothetical protein [Bacteroides sp.]
MNEEQKDKGLRKAAGKQPDFRLPSNFTYRTMLKVEEAVHLREKRTERNTLFATILAALFLIGCSVAGLLLYFEESIREAFTSAPRLQVEDVQIPSFYMLLIAAIPLFQLFDRWMRRQYFKRHP